MSQRTATDPAVQQAPIAQIATRFPHIVAVPTAADHTGEGIVGAGCDDRFELEFAFDLLLDGFERLHITGAVEGVSNGRRTDSPPTTPSEVST